MFVSSSNDINFSSGNIIDSISFEKDVWENIPFVIYDCNKKIHAGSSKINRWIASHITEHDNICKTLNDTTRRATSTESEVHSIKLILKFFFKHFQSQINKKDKRISVLEETLSAERTRLDTLLLKMETLTQLIPIPKIHCDSEDMRNSLFLTPCTSADNSTAPTADTAGPLSSPSIQATISVERAVNSLSHALEHIYKSQRENQEKLQVSTDINIATRERLQAWKKIIYENTETVQSLSRVVSTCQYDLNALSQSVPHRDQVEEVLRDLTASATSHVDKFQSRLTTLEERSSLAEDNFLKLQEEVKANVVSECERGLNVVKKRMNENYERLIRKLNANETSFSLQREEIAKIEKSLEDAYMKIKEASQEATVAICDERCRELQEDYGGLFLKVEEHLKDMNEWYEAEWGKITASIDLLESQHASAAHNIMSNEIIATQRILEQKEELENTTNCLKGINEKMNLWIGREVIPLTNREARLHTLENRQENLECAFWENIENMERRSRMKRETAAMRQSITPAEDITMDRRMRPRTVDVSSGERKGLSTPRVKTAEGCVQNDYLMTIGFPEDEHRRRLGRRIKFPFMSNSKALINGCPSGSKEEVLGEDIDESDDKEVASTRAPQMSSNSWTNAYSRIGYNNSVHRTSQKKKGNHNGREDLKESFQ